jgi:DNA-binding XRE family transcriptional regulator
MLTFLSTSFEQNTGTSFNYGRGFNFFDCHKTMVQMVKNALKEIRESLLMSKSELAREANVSPITITRIEEGKPCRLETKRKILLALGYSLSDSKKIFGE